MAELIITDEERAAATFLEWDNEALGKAVKKIALILNDDDGRSSLKHMAAGVFLISEAIRAGATESVLTLEGASTDMWQSESLGDWKITLTKQD